jgi:hypothetical protein
MMDFLRGLAPQHAHAKTRAVAALGSRFESNQPMRRVPPSAESDVQRDDLNPEVPSHVDALSRHDTIRHIESEARPQVRISSHPSPSREPVGRDVPIEGPLPSFRIDVRRGIEGAFIHERPDRADDESLLPIARGMRSQAVSHAEAVRVASPIVPSADARDDRAPLSQSAVAARMTPQSDRPAVVHVTIDRIDVRAPASTDDRSKPARSRAPSSSPSLAEYLRARSSSRRGGSS